MYKSKIIVAIIPARGGSKGIFMKNIKLIAGKPLIAYTIEAAKKSKYIDRIIVSTDDDEIAQVAKNFGAEVPFFRPIELSTDDAPTSLSLVHAVNYLEKTENYPVDIVVTLQPTSPLRTEKDIDEGIDIFNKGNFDSLIPLKNSGPASHYFRIENNIPLPILKNQDAQISRQKSESIYSLCGFLFITKKSYLLQNTSVFNTNNSCFYLVDKNRAIDIDDQLDMDMAELFLENEKHKN
jgi:CMP-N,N'-diacetyllegionaminic acid synthase